MYKIIESEAEYNAVMEQVQHYLTLATNEGGFHSLNQDQAAHLATLSKMAEAWEDSIPMMPIPHPQTLIGMIEYKMYEKKLKQKDLAALLEISPTRLSEILQSKRKINFELAKKLYKVLELDAKFILEAS